MSKSLEANVKWFAKFDPRQRLFSKVFIWFWLATLVMLGSGILLSRMLLIDVELAAVEPKELNRAQIILQRIERRLVQGQSIQQAINRSGKGRMLVMAFDEKGREPSMSFPRPLIRDWSTFKTLRHDSQSWSVMLRNSKFVGPFTLTQADETYQIFIGRLLPRNEVKEPEMITPVIIVVALLLSILFCFGLVWSLTRPIAQLRQATNAVAQGDLSTRIDTLAQRRDEIGQLARDFNYMTQRVEGLVTAQKQLLANVSHELRSPLTRLQLAVALLESASDPAKQAQHTSRIEKEIQQIDQLIGQLLNLAKADADRELFCESLRLTDLVLPVIDDAKFEALNLQKTIQVSAIPEMTLAVNVSLWRSALENVLRNALRHCHNNVSVRFDRLISQAHEGVSIVISDDGDGVAERHVAQLFEPFYRAKQTDELSAGLGLAITKAAVEHHGGSISAQNNMQGEQHVGFTVTMWFPLQPDP
jgi:two-component system sensor histidine kinase CpxA